MPVYKNLVGNKFSRLSVIKKLPNKKGRTYFLCKCECGKTISAMSKLLCNGHVKSCGCLQIEMRGVNSTTHGMSHSTFFFVWNNIRGRCYRANDKNFQYYGGKGIEVEWKTFEDFRDDMYPSYLEHVDKYGKKDTFIDRINNDGNYCKENCRWVTQKESARNKTNNHYLTYKEKIITLAELSEELGMRYHTLKNRIYLGWSMEEIINIPVGSGKRKKV